MKLLFWKGNKQTAKMANPFPGNGQDAFGSRISHEAMLGQLRQVLNTGDINKVFQYYETIKNEKPHQKILMDADIFIGLWAVSKVKIYLKYNRPDIAKEYLECTKKINYTQFFSDAQKLITEYKKNGFSQKVILEKRMN